MSRIFLFFFFFLSSKFYYIIFYEKKQRLDKQKLQKNQKFCNKNEKNVKKLKISQTLHNILKNFAAAP